MRPLDELTGGVQDPSASIVFGFVSLLPFSFFLRLSFLLSGGSPFFFGELYRCSTAVWPVFLSRWLSTLAATAGWNSRYKGPSPRGEGLWQVPDWKWFHVGAH